MALSLQERVMALRVGEPTRYRVEGALSKQAKFVLRVQGQSAGSIKLAKEIMLAPDAYAYRFGVAALTEPTFDAIESVTDVSDNALQGAVAELWPLFIPVAE
jgi:uncharacterized protein YhbP (UPF0306 family)